MKLTHVLNDAVHRVAESFSGRRGAERVLFWLTVLLLIIFSIVPRGYAMAANDTEGTSTESVGSSTVIEEPQPMGAPALANPVQTYPYKKTFVITSYYSPLPDQSSYVTGSYEGDVRLNGRGTNGADGTQVYQGILAAGRSIPFGTRIEIPDFGIGAVHDRGGAIGDSRLDIWVGRGEEGLRRALGWGRRTLECTVYGPNPTIGESINFAAIPLADLPTFVARNQTITSDISYGDSGEKVRMLQKYLKKLGYLNGEITGYFGDETLSAVKQFQLAMKIIQTENDSVAGIFGPRSQAAFEAQLASVRIESAMAVPRATLMRGAVGKDLDNVHKLLTHYGYLKSSGKNFDAATQDALIRFQIDMQIIERPTDRGAGIFGPKTQESFRKLLASSASTRFSLLRDGPAAFTKTLKLEDSSLEVENLQEFLFDLKFLGLAPTGYYGKITEHAVYKFQQAFNIVDDEAIAGAGVVGPKTLAKLNELAAGRTQQKRLIGETTGRYKLVAARLEDEKTLVANIVAGIFSAEMSYGSRSSDVENLQKILKRLGFFPGRLVTNYFGDITKRSLIAFQKSHGLNESGVLDDSTRKIMNMLVAGV